MYFSIGAEGKRNRWTVKVDGDHLSNCCEERIEFHKGRITFWEHERTKAEATLRSQGITLKHFEVTGGRRTEAQLDESLARRVSECESRLKSNKDSVNRFAAFKALLATTSPQEKYELSVDDVLYFNLNGADIDAETEDDE